jgi:fumarylacetoacetase
MKPVVPFVEHLSEDLSNTDPCLDVRCSATWQAADDNHGTYQPTEICRARYQETYWTYRQLLAHQTANGSITGSGDLLGTGTMSMFEVRDLHVYKLPSV